MAGDDIKKAFKKLLAAIRETTNHAKAMNELHKQILRNMRGGQDGR